MLYVSPPGWLEPKPDSNKCQWKYGDICALLVGETVQMHREGVWWFLTQLHKELTGDVMIPLPGIYPQTPALFLIVPKVEAAQMPISC